MSKSFQKRIGDPRIAEILGKESRNTEIAILGFPFDQGVKINLGRSGAKLAPDKIRERFQKLTPDATNHKQFTKILSKTVDLGNLRLPRNIAYAQRQLANTVSSLLDRSITPIIIGGGHETTYGHFMGYYKLKTSIGLVNFDAHPDVRPKISGSSHSGSSFRDALEASPPFAQGYTVFGLQPHAVAAEHLDYLRATGSQYFFKQECSTSLISNYFSKLKLPSLVSFDLDCVDQAFAPGVSAPCTGGFTPELIFFAAYCAGKCKSVRSIDIVEVNPKFDRDDQTSRLAALLIWHFLRGRAQKLR